MSYDHWLNSSVRIVLHKKNGQTTDMVLGLVVEKGHMTMRYIAGGVMVISLYAATVDTRPSWG